MRVSILLAILIWAFGSAGPANAHAALDRANPRVGSTVASAPRTVSLFFTQNIEPALSTIEVRNAAGARVDQGKARGGGNSLTIGLKALSPGTYQVHWRVLSVDTHKTEGTFSFQVGQ
jgi:methionine-rich copper-binding protein CopC